MVLDLTEKNKKDLIKLVRITIAERLNVDIDYKFEDFDFSDKIYSEKYGAFVTLHINGGLRGCIGYIEAYKPLLETIQEMAVAAAFNDPRFPELTAEEYKNIEVEISILSPIEEVTDINEIVVGRDGLIVSKSVYRGLLLPQVATENGWDRDQFISYTCMKAGLPADTWKNEEIKIEKFSAEVFNEK